MRRAQSASACKNAPLRRRWRSRRAWRGARLQWRRGRRSPRRRCGRSARPRCRCRRRPPAACARAPEPTTRRRQSDAAATRREAQREAAWQQLTTSRQCLLRRRHRPRARRACAARTSPAWRQRARTARLRLRRVVRLWVVPMPPRHAPPQPRAAGRRRRCSACRAACFAYSGCALSKRHDHSCAAGRGNPRWPHSRLLWLHSGSCLCCVRPASHHAARVGRRGRMRRSLRRASKQSRDESGMRRRVPGLRCSGRPWRRDAVICGFAVGG